MSSIKSDADRPMKGNVSTRSRATADNTTSRATYISSGTKITGEIRGKAGVVIDGELEGAMTFDDEVVIGTGGVVTGEIVAKVVRIGGKVVGNVRGLQLVEVQPTGRIEGDVSSPRVMISEGAFFKGNVEMGEEHREQIGQPRPQ